MKLSQQVFECSSSIVVALVLGVVAVVAAEQAQELSDRGTVLAAQGDYEAAEIQLQGALAMVRLERAEALDAADSSSPEAISPLDRVEYDTCMNLALVLVKMGRTAEAMPHLRRALQLNDTASVHFSLGFSLKLLGELREAANHLALALERDPERHRGYIFLAEALIELGDDAAAEAALRQAYVRGSDRLSLDMLGLTLRRLGRADDEAALYAEAVARGLLVHASQRPPTLTRGLDSHDGFFTEHELPWLAELHGGMAAALSEFEANWGTVASRELVRGVGEAKYHHDRALFAASNGSWYELALWESGRALPAAYSYPAAVEAVFRAVPAALDYGRLIFSAIEPGVRLKPHVGPTNERLTVHCGMRVPSPADALYIRVGAHRRSWREGECFVFDDSFEHEVYVPQHVSGERVIMLFHVPHPQLAAVRQAARAASAHEPAASLRSEL